MAYDKDELEKLQMLAESIKIILDAGNQQFLFKPEEILNNPPAKRVGCLVLIFMV